MARHMLNKTNLFFRLENSAQAVLPQRAKCVSALEVGATLGHRGAVACEGLHCVLVVELLYLQRAPMQLHPLCVWQLLYQLTVCVAILGNHFEVNTWLWRGMMCT